MGPERQRRRAVVLVFPDGVVGVWDQLEKQIKTRDLAGFLVAGGILFGIVLFVAPVSGALAITWLIGFFALFVGMLLLGVAWRLRKSHASVDVYASPMRTRIFDSAASALIVREAGGLVTDLEGRSLDGMPIDLSTRTTLLASAHPDLHRLALDLLGD